MDILNTLFKFWIRTLGALASISILRCIFIDWQFFAGQSPDPTNALETFGTILLPAFIAVFTSIGGLFWVNLIIGLWFIVIGVIDKGSPQLLLSALALSATPFLRMAFPFKPPPSKETDAT